MPKRCALLLLLTWHPAIGQGLPPGASARVYANEPSGYRFDGRVEEWKSVSPLASPNENEVWIRSTATGLLFAGRLGRSITRIELTLAGPRDFMPPPPGWLTRFGYQTYESRGQCGADDPKEKDACLQWYDRTLQHQAALSGFFRRQYVMTSQGVAETVATPAWKAGRLPAALAPSGMPRYLTSGQTFEIELPWNGLPLWDSTTMDGFRWGLRAFAEEDNPIESFPLQKATLATPRHYGFTECGSALPKAAYDQAWFQPGGDTLVTKIATLDYPLAYHPSFALDVEVAPVVGVSEGFSDLLEPGVWFCGPEAAQSWRGQAARAAPPRNDYSGWRGGLANPGLYRKQRLADGRWLIASAPQYGSYGWMGGGQCGSCIVWTANVWLLSPAGISHIATFESPRLGDAEIQDWDLHYGADLRFLDIFEQLGTPGQWRKQRHCFAAGRYQPCGPAVKQAPARRVTKTPEQVMGN